MKTIGNRAGAFVALVAFAVLLAGCGGGQRPPVVIVQQPLGPAPVTPQAPAPGPLTGPVTTPVPGLPQSDATPVINGAEGQALDAVVRAYAQKMGRFNGTVLVARAGVVLLSQGYGVSDAARQIAMRPDTVWDWCSVSKQFTATAMLKLQMMGRLRIDDPIGRYLACPADRANITIRQLLTMTSGLSQWDVGYDNNDEKNATLARMMRQPIVCAPGTRFDYNNANFTLCAMIIERVTGNAFEQWMIANIFRPAGLSDAAYLGCGGDTSRCALDKDGTGTQTPLGNAMPGWWRGAAGAMMPMRQLLCWDAVMRGNTILDEASKAQLYTVALENYALGWSVYPEFGEVCYTHDGALSDSHVTQYLRTRDSQIVIAIGESRYDEQLYDLVKGLLSQAKGVPAGTTFADEAPGGRGYAKADHDSFARMTAQKR